MIKTGILQTRLPALHPGQILVVEVEGTAHGSGGAWIQVATWAPGPLQTGRYKISITDGTRLDVVAVGWGDTL